jgi:hypothetical protein
MVKSVPEWRPIAVQRIGRQRLRREGDVRGSGKNENSELV